MRRAALSAALALFFGVSPAWSADDALGPLKDALAEVRSSHGQNEERDAGPELTLVKHRLRAWVEQQLPPEPVASGPDQPIYLPGPAAYAAIGARLSKALDDAGLTCGDTGSSSSRCGGEEESGRGFVGQVSISTADYGRYAVVVTGVGIRCGEDQSLYIYKRDAARKWKLLFQSEQDAYDAKVYAPQEFLSVNLSPSQVAWNEPAPPPLVATLGFPPWCSSNWHTLFTRLWRASESEVTPAAILDANDDLFMGDDFVAAARLTSDDFLVQFMGGSMDEGRLVRLHLRHYLVDSTNKLKRIGPVALGPEDFLEEWLAAPLVEAQRWTEPRVDMPRLNQAHNLPHDPFFESDGPVKRCRTDAELWQVTVSPLLDHGEKTGPPTYFLVRWQAPYRFSMVDAEPKSFTGCDEAITLKDDIGTLFPMQGWAP